MSYMTNFAWLGTGACDPNKDLKETLVYIGIAIGWGVVVYLLVRVAKSKLPTAAKIGIIILALLAAGSATYIAYIITVIALACSG